MRALAVALLLLAATACAGEETAQAPAEEEPAALRIAEPGALALDPSGGLLVADRALHRVLRLDPATEERSLVVSGIRDIVALAFDDSGRLYVGADERIYRIDGAHKTVIAGTGRRRHSGDEGPATAASLAGATGFEVDHDERIVIAEYDNWIRVVETDGTAGTLAGTGEEGYQGDGGPAVEALLAHPHDIALRRDRVVVIADSHNGVLRRIDSKGVISTLATGFVAPILVDGGPGDSLYVADGEQNTIFRIPPGGRQPERVGTATAPIGMAVDHDGSVYVSELGGERRVLRIELGGTARTLAEPG